jgi:hypothetical protein
MTDPITKRTMIVIGDYTHHGQAGQGYFMIGEKPYNSEDKLGFGNVILWNNVGDLEEKGFLGIDFQYKCDRNSGAAKSLEDVVNVLDVLKAQGFSGKRKVVLLRTPYLRESSLGIFLRTERKTMTLNDYLKMNPKNIQAEFADYSLKNESKLDDKLRNNMNNYQN